MNFVSRRFLLISGSLSFYHLLVEKETTSTPLDESKGYDKGETIYYTITVTNDGNTLIDEPFYVVDELTENEWTVLSLGVGESEEFLCHYDVTSADLLAGEVINESTIRMSNELEELWYDNNNEDPEHGVSEDPTYYPIPSIVLTETSTPSNGESYEEGETITITVTVTGDSKYPIYDGEIITRLQNNNQSWILGTLIGEEYVLAANAVNTFTWTHTVTAADVANGTITFSVAGDAEAFREFGGATNIDLFSNNLTLNVSPNYNYNYLTFEALESGTFSFNMYSSLATSSFLSMAYSLDNGITWVTENNIDSTQVKITTPTVLSGAKVLWRGYGTQLATGTSSNTMFSSTGAFNVSGNVMSVLYGDNFLQQTLFANTAFPLSCLFYSCTNLISAKNLRLPVTNFSNMTNSYARPYYQMFYGCSSLTIAPKLPATRLTIGCYWGMFTSCRSLTVAPALPATTLSQHCYRFMFLNCTSLQQVPNLPATSPVVYCYRGMFQGCTSLTTIPKLNLTSIPAETCYNMYTSCTGVTTVEQMTLVPTASSSCSSMFSDCTSLIDASPITISRGIGCASMFYGCTSMTTPPSLTATSLSSGCYSSMFYGCIEMTLAPELPATTLASTCYSQMFYNCNKLSYIKMLATNISATNCLNNWTRNVAKSGVFIQNSEALWFISGPSGIPAGWTVLYNGNSTNALNYYNTLVQNATSNCFKTKALSSGTITLSIPSNITTEKLDWIEYSTDNGSTWTRTNNSAALVQVTTPLLSANDVVLWRGQGTGLSRSSSAYSNFSSTCLYEVYGRLLSLVDMYLTATMLELYEFAYLFKDNTKLINASNLTLESNTLTSYCYYYLFSGCSNLLSAPSLPSLSLLNYCYAYMFKDCTALTTSPALPATTMKAGCYQSMFEGCTSLTTAPQLTATTVDSYSYQSMFKGCTSLTTAPELPATTISYSSYKQMFMNCTSLVNGPSELPATKANYSTGYLSMFENCTSLVVAPTITTTESAINKCFERMFYGCSRLNYIKAMFSPLSGASTNWVYGVASTGTFVRNTNYTGWANGINGIPSGWTVQTASS